MNSFYGGKQGRTYHIVQRYDVVSLASLTNDTSFIEWTDLFPEGTQSINIKAGQRIKINNSESNIDYYVFETAVENASSNFEDHLSKTYKLTGMVDSFSNGGSYTGANYGEYVLIDTVHVFGRSNLENGLLYRRGFNYQEQIVTRPTPADNQEVEVFQARLRNWMLHPGAGAIYVGQIIGPMGLTPEIELVEWDEETAAASSVMGSVSYGKDGEDNYNDYIRASSITVRDEKGDITGAQIAFDIPKPVFEIGEINTDPYENPSITESTDSIDHPFYNKWDFVIPGGKKGASLTGLGLEGTAPAQVLSATITNYDSNAEGSTSASTFPWRVIDTITTAGTERSIIDTVPHSVQVGSLFKVNDKYLVCIDEGNGTLSTIPSSSFNYGDVWSDSTNNSVWRCIDLSSTFANALNISYTNGSGTTHDIRNLDYLTAGLDGKIYAKYTDNSEQKYLTTLNSVRAIDKQGDTIVVAYANPDLVSGSTIEKALFDPATGITSSTYTWHNLGTLPAQYHVFGLVNETWIQNHPNGFHGDPDYPDYEDESGYEGWLVSIYGGDGSKHLLAYDYTGGTHTILIPGTTQPQTPGSTISNTHWYEVMDLTAQNLNPSHTIIATNNQTTASDSLKSNGYWFVVSQ